MYMDEDTNINGMAELRRELPHLTLREIKILLDKFLLETLELIEQDIAVKMEIEKVTNEGYLNIAKTR